jgi:hypothetical protein
VHDPKVRSVEAAKPPKVEVERVDEDRRGCPGYPVHLDRKPSALELPFEGEQELVSATIRRRSELMEECDISTGALIPKAIHLGGCGAPGRTSNPSDAHDSRAASITERHAATLDPAAERRPDTLST